KTARTNSEMEIHFVIFVGIEISFLLVSAFPLCSRRERADLAAPTERARRLRSRLRRERRSCGRSSRQPHGFAPEEFAHPLSRVPSALLDRLCGCKLPHSLSD